MRLSILIVIVLLVENSSGLCLFGSKKDCYFPCRCNQDSSSECNRLTGIQNYCTL